MKKILTFFVFVIAGAIATAQDKNTSIQAFFDFSTTNIGKNYKGHDCLKIASSLKSRKLKKDEYETTEEFNRRIIENLTTPLYGSLRGNDVLALVRKSRLEPTLKYDADTHKLTINVNVSGQLIFIGRNSYSSDTLELSHGKESSYLGTNAFGATVRVKKIESKACSVAFSQPKFDIRNPLLIEIPNIKPEEARYLKGNIDIIYIGNLEEPYIGDIFKHLAATIDSPTEITTTGDAIIIKIEEIWLINKITGDVLIKKKNF